MAAASAGDLVRTILVLDHEPVGALPAVTDVLESASLRACYNKDKVGSRFKVLSDRMVPVQNTAASVTTALIPYHVKHKLDFVTYYQSNAGTISDLLKNNLVIISIGGNGLATSNINWQMCYKDI